MKGRPGGLLDRVLFAGWAAIGTLAIPALRLLLRRRLRRGKEVRAHVGERRGIDPTRRPAGRLIWLHAASVGETLSLLPLIQALRRADPALIVLLTTGTRTAHQLAGERLETGNTLFVRFAPLDVPLWTGRFLDRWRPDLLVLVESELWPTVIAACNRRDVPVALINARMSDRSVRRWRRIAPVANALLSRLSLISARSALDASRLRELCTAPVEQETDLKRAAEPLPFDAPTLDDLKAIVGARPVWLAASTHENEEAVILAAHAALLARHPTLLLILVPRHPDRAQSIVALDPGMRRRALGQAPGARDGVWLCDTLGELGLFYRLCSIVLIGNSLAEVSGPAGGHNPLEPARLGCALAAGPRMQNFADDTQDLLEARALTLLRNRRAIEGWVATMLEAPDARQAAQAAALRIGAGDSDLAERLARRLLRLRAGSTP